jgi:hypothetical protein
MNDPADSIDLQSLSDQYRRQSRDHHSSRGSQGPPHELDNQALIVPSMDSMTVVRIDHQLEILVGLLERAYELQRVLHMHVVITDAVNEQESAM